MQTRTRALVIRGAIVGVLALFGVATALFVAQGGFGGGQGRFDRALFILGLPWVLMPWPESVGWSDYLRVVVLPFGLDLCTVLALRFLLASGRTPSERRP